MSKQKLSLVLHADNSLFAMTSGLRSVRDKTMIYLDEDLQSRTAPFDRLYRIVNLFGEKLRIVRQEDEAALKAGGMTFNTHAIIGGLLGGDAAGQLFYVYPEGNWIEAAVDSPYFIIGRTHYGKPILDRLLSYETPLPLAVALALLAFDATRASVTDVDCPIDIAVLSNASRQVKIHRFTQDDISEATQWWSQSLAHALKSMPLQWAASLFE